MPTRSDRPQDGPSGSWEARSNRPKRSVFGNYSPEPEQSRGSSAAAGSSVRAIAGMDVDRCVARSYLYRTLALALEDPSCESWSVLRDPDTVRSLTSAGAALGEPVLSSVRAMTAALGQTSLDSFTDAYIAAFGHAARGTCPPNETEYSEAIADPLFQPHRLADLAAFYRAFGLEVATGSGERHDHVCMELEFLCVLAAKEAYALEHRLADEELSLCRDAQRKFLREHLGRWTPAFTRMLAASTVDPLLRSVAELLRGFVEAECARFGVNPGSVDLALRPVEESAERMCDSCGISNLPPGALAAS